MLCVSYPDHHLRIDGRTGRLVEFRVDKANEDEPQIQVTIARGEFERRLRQIDEVTAGFAETAEVTHGLSSACSFLCDEVLTWLPTTENPNTRRLVSISRQLAGAGIFRPCDRLLVEAFRPVPIRRKFSIPLPTFNVHVNEKTYTDIIKLAPYWGLPLCDALWPVESWICDLWREATLAAAGRTQNSADELARQFWSPEIGPLHCLLNGELAHELGVSQLATIYARHARSRLTMADFQHDYAPLVSPKGFVGQCVLSAADALRRLNDEDRRVLLDAIVGQNWLAPDAAQMIDSALSRMQMDQRPIALALSAELDAWWESSLQATVKNMLVSLAKTGASDTPKQPEPPTYGAGAEPATYGAAAGPPKPPRNASNQPLFDLWQILSYSDTYPAARIETMRAGSSGAQSGPIEPPPVGLSSQCPVTFRDEHVWRQGDDRFGAVHRGHVYLFTSAAKQARFLADPDRYCPVDSGYDVVNVIEQHRDRRGKPEFAVLHDGRIYLFESEETRAKFLAHPARYVVVPTTNVAAAEPGNRPDKPARR
jgi:YHS domain-containing protein